MPLSGAELSLDITMLGAKESVSSIKSLSGGEQSYVTVAFLLAMADTADMGALMALDEWDVFMDPINRKISFQVRPRETAGCRNPV